jgi:hypothetical protein
LPREHMRRWPRKVIVLAMRWVLEPVELDRL